MRSCAHFLGSQVSCLHFRQFWRSCKCSAAKYAQLSGILLISHNGVIRAVRRRANARFDLPDCPRQITMPTPKRTAAIIVAAGRGLRAGSGGPKQYRSIGGRTVISRAMEPFCRHPQVFAVQPVLNPDDAAMFNDAVCDMRYQSPADGGATRQVSVRAGLEALVSQSPDIVLIHDAARPFVTAAVILRAMDAASLTGAAVPAIAVTDTIKLIGDGGHVEATPERARLRIAQTPQSFVFEV